MKIATLNLGNNIIETRNNIWTGVETVYFNGYRVSKQFNWFVGIHNFEALADDGVNTDYYRVEFRFSFTTGAITTDIFRNGECVLDMSNTNHRYATPTATALPAPRDNRPAKGDWIGRRAEKVAKPLYREEDLV
jgi:hypothetical protein